MSAFAADQHVLSMTERAAKPSLPSITARTSAAEKARFRSLATRAGMSESALALVAIRRLLDPEGKTPQTTVALERLAATDRITIRLRPGDGAAVARRAAARGMKASAYVSGLVRAHLRGNPPLPAAELAALKDSVEVLGGLGHVLARLARSARLVEPDREEVRKEIAYVRIVLANLEQQTHDLAKAALIAWESSNE
jgi:predicted DNA binding CopG/RHH family protein